MTLPAVIVHRAHGRLLMPILRRAWILMLYVHVLPREKRRRRLRLGVVIGLIIAGIDGKNHGFLSDPAWLGRGGAIVAFNLMLIPAMICGLTFLRHLLFSGAVFMTPPIQAIWVRILPSAPIDADCSFDDSGMTHIRPDGIGLFSPWASVRAQLWPARHVLFDTALGWVVFSDLADAQRTQIKTLAERHIPSQSLS